MELHMTFKHMEATPGLKTHVKQQTDRLKKFVNGQAKADWTFYLEATVQVADLRVHGPHLDFFAQARTDDLYKSIDEATEKVEKQLRKHKEIVKNHVHRKRKEPTKQEHNDTLEQEAFEEEEFD